MALLIDRSGYRLDIPETERIDDMVVDVAAGRMDLAALIVWFGDRLVRN